MTQTENNNEKYQGIRIVIYPNQKQINQIELNINHARYIYNHTLAWQIERHENKEKFPGKFDFTKHAKELKDAHPWLKEADSTSLQDASLVVYDTYQRFFHYLCKKPRFKSRHEYNQSYTSTNVIAKKNGKIARQSIKINEHRIKLPKLAWMRYKGDLNAIHNIKLIKAATIRRLSTNQYVVSLRVIVEKPILENHNRIVGLDMGLADLCITSDGKKYGTTRYYEPLEAKLLFWQKRTARRRILAKKREAQAKREAEKYKEKTGIDQNYPEWREAKNYQIARKMVAKYHKKIADQRDMDIHKLTTEIVRNYDVIKMEDLSVGNMLKNHHLARAISNQAWNKFKMLLKYKCDWYGKQLIFVNPYKTSQICHVCGYDDGNHGKANGLAGLQVRSWTCPNCHTKLDRDINAAINIKNKEALPEKKHISLKDKNPKKKRATGKKTTKKVKPEPTA